MKKVLNQKKIIIITIIAVLIAAGIVINIIKDRIEDKNAIKFSDNLNVEFDSDAKVSNFIDLINGKIIEDTEIDTTSLGEKIVEFKYKNPHNTTKKRNVKINVIDTVKPVTYINSSMTVVKGYNKDLTQVVLSGDNCDSNPRREIVGDYDFNKVGTYNLIFKITDSSNNTTEKPFTLNVVESIKNSETTNASKVKFSDAVNTYKKDDNSLGIDVSEWQGEIDWKKVKEAGCDFVFIRIGYQNGFDGEIKEDKYFKKNIEGALANNIKVGGYFNSYAKTSTETKEQAEWTYNKIKDYNIELPISFDWENWNSFVKCQLSFYDINNMAQTFINTLETRGYKSSLYSSKNYLQKIWYASDYENIWLAQYAKKADYEEKYQYWQMCNTGKIDGIYGDVDIDISLNY